MNSSIILNRIIDYVDKVQSIRIPNFLPVLVKFAKYGSLLFLFRSSEFKNNPNYLNS